MSKPKLQARQAALSFSEKIKILEKLRDREKAIAASGLRQREDVPSLISEENQMISATKYEGDGTTMAFSADGETYVSLPKLDRISPHSGVVEHDRLDCLDGCAPVNVAMVEGSRGYLAEGNCGSVSPALAAVHSFHQAMKTVHFRIMLVDKTTIEGKCLIDRFDLNPPRFRLHITELPS